MGKIVSVYESKFVKVFDLQYAEGKHYLNATRRSEENLVAAKNIDEFKSMLPDAVSIAVILKVKGEPDKLLLSREYRYPAAQFLLSPPAGLIDSEDADGADPLIATAKRELAEETGIKATSADAFRVINPLLFSTPGMTDESNALVEAIIVRDEMPNLSQEGAVGSEKFDGFVLLTREEAKEVLTRGTDDRGIFYSVYTWAVLMHFVNM